MKIDAFVKGKRDVWNRLERLVQAHPDLRKAPEEDVAEMIRLYRAVCADYAYARVHYPYDRVVVELTGLVGRAHKRIYGSKPFRWRSVWDFFVRDFPDLVRQNRRFIALAATAFFLSAVLAFVGSLENPDLPRHVLGDVYVDATLDHINDNDPFAVYKQDSSPVMSSFIMTNNIKVTLVAFGLGIFLGLGSLYVMIHNGLTLGAFFFVFFKHGLLLESASTVMMHGVIELTCVFIAGGAGLMIGKAIVLPGHFTRADSLRQTARQAVQMVLGLIPLLVSAGLIEGFVTGLDLPNTLKWPFVLATAIGLLLYFGQRRGQAEHSNGDRKQAAPNATVPSQKKGRGATTWDAPARNP